MQVIRREERRDESMAEQEKDMKDLHTEETADTAEVTAEELQESAEDMTEDADAVEDDEAEEGECEDADIDDADGSEAGKKSWAEKRAAKKQAKADKQTDAAKEKIAELEDKVLRQMAEFENFRKRTGKEKQEMFETGAKSVIEKILPVVDNFERGFATVDPEDEEDAFVNGMRMIYKQLMTELDNIGVKPIEAVGKEFDPNFHNAVMQVASEEYENGIVAQEFIKGYTYRDSVVRHSMVAVAE